MTDEPTPTTATVVFTDMVGSTALRSSLGEERADELRRIHDGLLTARVEAHRGRVLKGRGDGLVATFAAASDALSAAVELQQVIAAYNRRRDALAQISIRVGLSTGDVSWEAGDCFGAPMVEAARLEAAAEGGQILCSEYVRMMARGRGGHEFRPIGFLELKGLPEPLPANEVLWVSGPDPGALPLPPELAVEPARPFVSRRAELRVAEDVLPADGRDRLAVLWLLGEPGIGKTRLATEIARRAHASGDVVLFGRCNEDLAVPYQPFLEALRWFVTHVADDQLAERLGAAPGELIRLLPELADRLPYVEAPRLTSPELDQHRFFESVRSWLAAAGDGRPVVAVLDDLHWADRSTLALLGHAARSAEASRTLFVCTARTTSPDDNEAMAALVEELSRRGAPSVSLELTGLVVEDVGELVSSATGQSLDEGLRQLAGELHHETAGNPLFIDALLSSLPAGAASRPVELPHTLAETVSRHVGRLPNEVADVLRAASVAGLDFDLRVAARAAGFEELQALEALERAARAGLVEESGPNRYRFAHGLVRSALRRELAHSRRSRIHLRVGEALEALAGARLDEHVTAIAHHFFEAAPAGGTEKAYHYAILAGKRADRLLAHHEAVEAYGRALELLDQIDGEDPLARSELLLARGHAESRSGNFEMALETLRAAAEEASARSAAEHLAGAAIAYELTGFTPGSPGPAAVELLRRAEAALPAADSSLLALTLASSSRALEFAGRRMEGIDRGEEALAMAERLGEPKTTAEVLLRTSFAYTGVEHTTTMAVRCGELMALARQLQDEELKTWALGFSVYTSAQLGDLATFDRLLAEVAPLIEQLRQPVFRHALVLWRQLRATLAGELERSEQLLEEASELGRAFGWGFEGIYALVTFLLRREQGRLADVAPTLKLVVRLNPGATLWRPGLAALYAELGMLDEARAQFEDLAAGHFAAVPRDGNRLLLLGLLAEVCCALNDAERAAELLNELRPAEGRILVFFSPVCLGPTDRLLGMLASVAGLTDDADRWHGRALEVSRRMDSPPWIAHCLYDYAAHLLGTHPGRAAAMLVEAAQLCQRHGLAGMGRRVTAARR